MRRSHTPFSKSVRSRCDRFEVLKCLLGDAALGVSRFVAVVPVIRPAARKHVDNRSALAQVVEAQIEETRALAIDHSDTQRGLRTQQTGQRLQLKSRLEINVRASQVRREFVFFPEVLSGTGKHSPSPRAAAQVRRDFQHAIEVGVQRAVLARRDGASQGLLDDIFGDNRLAPM
jgi:hypothetical protein